MRIAIICQGRTFLNDRDEANQLTLTPSIDLLKNTLAKHGWNVKVMQPHSQKDYEKQIDNLKECLPDTKNIEFLLYYIGHGKSARNEEYELCFEEHDLPVNKIISWTRKLFNPPPRYMSLVLDCCYSGDAIKDTAKNYDIEFLTSTDTDTKTFEVKNENNQMVSEFANSFCDALESINHKENISLEDIAGHIGGKSFYSPSNPNPTDKLTIGYAKDRLDIRNILLKYDFNTLRYASLHYIDKNAILRDKIVQVDTIVELIDEICKNEQCLYCLLKELSIDIGYFKNHYNCQKLKEDRKVASILVILESETKEKLEDMEFEVTIYCQYEDAIDYELLDRVATEFDSIGKHLENAHKAKDHKNQVEFIFMVPNEVFIDSVGTNKLSKLELNTGSLGNDDILDIGNISYKILMRYKHLEECKSAWEENSEHFITYINSNIKEYRHSDNATAFNHEAKILQETTTKFTNKMLEMHIKRGICASLYDTNSINLNDVKVQNMKKHIFLHLKKHKESFFICNRYDEKVIELYKKSQKTNANNNTTKGEGYVNN